MSEIDLKEYSQFVDKVTSEEPKYNELNSI